MRSALSKFGYRFNAVTMKIPIAFFNTQAGIKIYVKIQKIKNNQGNILKEGRIWRTSNNRYQFF